MMASTVWQLARLADCADPDTDASPGAAWLHGVEAAAQEIEDEDEVSELADQLVPIYTAEVWSVFTDLGAYNEDPTDLGCDGSDMEQAAKVCLYIIAERLLHALKEDAR